MSARDGRSNGHIISQSLCEPLRTLAERTAAERHRLTLECSGWQAGDRQDGSSVDIWAATFEHGDGEPVNYTVYEKSHQKPRRLRACPVSVVGPEPSGHRIGGMRHSPRFPRLDSYGGGAAEIRSRDQSISTKYTENRRSYSGSVWPRSSRLWPPNWSIAIVHREAFEQTIDSCDRDDNVSSDPQESTR